MRFFLLLSLVLSFSANSQDFEFENSTEIVNGLLDSDPNVLVQLNGYTDVVNNTGEAFNAFSRYEIVSQEPDSFKYSFCWALCYGETDTVSLASNYMAVDQTIYAGYDNVAFIQGFAGYYKCNLPGATVIRQFFYDQNENYISHLDFTYCTAASTEDFCAVGVNEQSENQSFLSSPYPNPAGDEFKIDYDTNTAQGANLTIKNTIGQETLSVKLTNSRGTESIDTSELEAGIYFISIELDGKTMTSKKLIVN